jgi:hypothetical protein
MIVPFASVSVLNIAYSTAMKSRFGKVPHVKVYHKDGTDYIEPMIDIRLQNPTTVIKINNGGPATGFVKIFR